MSDVPEPRDPMPDDAVVDAPGDVDPGTTPAPVRRGIVTRVKDLAARLPVPRPQTKAAAASVHAEVTCGECHVTPTVAGFIKAKLEGTRELKNLVSNTYPMPIPPIEHHKMPDTKDTCQRCHAPATLDSKTGPNSLVLRTTYASDAANSSRTDLAVLLRPANAGTPEALGVHWHVQQPVSFTSTDEHDQEISTVQYTDQRTGTVRSFIRLKSVHDSNNADAEVARVRADESVRTMDCMTCHNRVGHPIPTAQRAVDDAMALGEIDASLPYIKRNAVALLTKPYATREEGQTAIRGLGSFYQAEYPDVAGAKQAQIEAASTRLSKLFADLVTPEMKAGAGTYLDNLGHQAGQGCFRCHDGAHYEVIDNKVTNKTIRSTCDTCHTFPQLTGTKANAVQSSATTVMKAVPLGVKPADHTPLFVFDHKILKTDSCSACHTQTYCDTCHDSGAVKVEHDQMVYQHSVSVRAAGGTKACAVCHQLAACEQCHVGDWIGPSNSRLDRKK